MNREGAVLPILEKFAALGMRHFAATGSVAAALHLGEPARVRNDLDLVVPSFASIPGTLAAGFLIRHVHADATDGRMLLQLVDAGCALRIDIFLACGATFARSRIVAGVRAVSVEDLAARAARLAMDTPAERKHVETLRRLKDRVDPELAEAAWRDHRKAKHPGTFREACTRMHGQLVETAYSHDITAICGRCQDIGPFRRSPAADVHAILGYC